MEIKKFPKLNSYNGFLTPDKAAKGISAARQNAQSLLRDAELLFQHDRWSRSVSLSALSIEEAGKISLCTSPHILDMQVERI